MDYQDGWTYYDDIYELSYEERRARLFEQCEPRQPSCPASPEPLVQHGELPQPYQDDVFTASAEVPQRTEAIEAVQSEEVTNRIEVELPAGNSDEKWDNHGYRWKMCLLCDVWINVGKSKGKDGALRSHRGSKPCQANTRKREAAAANAARLTAFPSLPQPQQVTHAQSVWNNRTSLSDLQASRSSSYSLPEPPAMSSSHSYTGIRSLESPLPRRTISGQMSTTHRWLRSNTNTASPSFMAPDFDDTSSPYFLSAPSSSGRHSHSAPSSASTSRTLLSEIEDQTCSGIALTWTVGPIYTTYPMHLHSLAPQSLGYHFSYMDPKGVNCWITSDTCTKHGLKNGKACLSCQRLAPVVKTLHDRALKLNPTTNNVYANFVQMRERLDEKTMAIRQLKLDVRTLIILKYAYLSYSRI